MSDRILLVSINMGLVIQGVLPAAAVGNAYSATLTALNGIEPYVWALSSVSGALPAGLTITTDGSGDGLISGTPTVAGAYPIQVLCTDARGISATRNFRLVVQ